MTVRYSTPLSIPRRERAMGEYMQGVYQKHGSYIRGKPYSPKLLNPKTPKIPNPKPYKAFIRSPLPAVGKTHVGLIFTGLRLVHVAFAPLRL